MELQLSHDTLECKSIRFRVLQVNSRFPGKVFKRVNIRSQLVDGYL